MAAEDLYRLNISVTAADGRVTRWGGDELNSKDVPTGLTFSTSIPGGNKDMSCALMRQLTIDYSDEAIFDDVRVYGPGNETAWEGRMVQFPRQHAEQFSVNPGAVGWSAHLLDDPSFRENYVHRDLSGWKGTSLTRKVALLAASYGTPTEPAVVVDATNAAPCLQTQCPSQWTATRSGVAEAIFDTGVPIGAILYHVTTFGDTSTADAGWTWRIETWSNDSRAGADSSGNLRASTPVFQYFNSVANYPIAAITMFYTLTAAGAANNVYALQWADLAIFGAHNLPIRGTPTVEAVGFYASDVIADIIGRAAPLLAYSTGAGGSISPTSFIIPHLAFLDPVTAEDAISTVNAFHLYEWGVYDNREFFWRPPDPNRLTWEARLSEGAQVSLEGDDANNIFNGVFVTYTDPAGRKSTVGPPGSVADSTSTSLVDTSSTNPVNAHGIPRRWGRLDISNTTTLAGATQLGAIWLAEHNQPSRRGQLTLVGLVQHPTQGKRPVWAVRAGDFIRIADRPNDPPRRIIETSYDHDSRRLTASLDQTVFKLEAIMERMGVNLVGVI